MKKKFAKFELDGEKHEAAQLIANGDLQITQIAKKLGTTKQTIHRWKQRPEFAALIEEKKKALAERLLNEGIASKQIRIRKYQSLFDRLEQAVQERGEALASHGFGCASGLVCRTEKVIGAGPFAKTVAEYEIDIPVVREMRELMKQAGQEKGDFVEKIEHTGKDGGPIRVDLLKNLPDDELELLEKLLEKAQKQEAVNEAVAATNAE